MVNREQQRQDIAKRSEVALVRLIPACDIILDVCLNLISRASGKPFDRDHPLTPNMFLAAQFLQGIDITRQSIVVGAYHQAANLLKQETEILGAMYETRTGTRKDRETAKFRGDMRSLGRKYGELNDIAHPTYAAVVELFSSKIEGDNVDPTLEIQFNEELCKNFFGYHSLLVSRFSDELLEVVTPTIGIGLTNDEEGLIVNAIKALANEGAFILGSEANSEEAVG